MWQIPKKQGDLWQKPNKKVTNSKLEVSEFELIGYKGTIRSYQYAKELSRYPYTSISLASNFRHSSNSFKSKEVKLVNLAFPYVGTVRMIFRAPSTKYFILTARVISRWVPTLRGTRILKADTHPCWSPMPPYVKVRRASIWRRVLLSLTHICHDDGCRQHFFMDKKERKSRKIFGRKKNFVSLQCFH